MRGLNKVIKYELRKNNGKRIVSGCPQNILPESHC